MPDPAQVFVEDFRGIGQVYMRLLGSTDAEDETTLNKAVLIDGGVLSRGSEEA
ncbi:hypothetical protein ACLRGI_03315 [Paenarthrobacter nitroguajacolicus]|uniref:hypothetical protein n=1 Tax=Paenarthrobacter nitroguajacolicus TaxID=211146 RepID=UPI003AEA418B